MGQFRRDGTGAWYYKFEYKGKVHKRRGFATQRAAAEAEWKRRSELSQEAGEPVPTRPSITVADYFELWMGEHVKTQCRPSTADLYRDNYERYLRPRFGKLALGALKRGHVRALLAELEGYGLGRSGVNNVLIPFRAMLNAAKDDELIEGNPAASFRRGRPREARERLVVSSYTTEQLASILEAYDRLGHGDADLVHTLARAGLRLSEASGLRPEDIKPGYLEIRRGVHYRKRRLDVYPPKSGKFRRVDISAALEERLRRRLARVMDWLFPADDPTFPVRPEPVRRRWNALLAELDVPKLRLHDLRHTYACLLLQGGAPIAYVKEQLGHSSIQMTVDIYGHMIPGANRKWIDQLM